MNKGKALSKKQLSILLLILLILGLLSAAVLASRMGGFNKRKDDGKTIPIGDDANKIHDDDEDPDRPLEAELVVEHSYEIFRVSYSNDSGEMTVRSSNGDKVIAPGASWNYKFSLLNTKEVSLDYELYATAIIEGTDLEIPVVVRLKGPEDKWVTGKRGAYVPVLDLNRIKDTGVLAGGNVANYRLSWKWPFESGGEEADAFDTLLSDLALDDDITLTIKIWVYAWTDEIPDRPGGDPIPGTGDDFNVAFWMSLMIISLFVFIAVLTREKRRVIPVQEALGCGAVDGGEQKE